MRTTILQTPFCSIKSYNDLKYVLAKDLRTARNKSNVSYTTNCSFRGYEYYKNSIKKDDELFEITLQHRELINENVTYYIIAYYFSEAEDLAMKLIKQSEIYTLKEKSKFYISNSTRLGDFIN